MTAQRRYANLRHDLRTEMPEVYTDAALFGCYVQLYLTADAGWPATAEVPRIVDDELLGRLARMRKVVRDRQEPYLYRLPSLDELRDGEVERGRQNYMKRKDRPTPPEPDYRPLIDAFYESNRPPVARAVAPTKPLPTTNGRDKRTLPAESAPLPDGAPPRLEEMMGGTFEEIIGRPSKRNGSEGSGVSVSERMAEMISEGGR